MEEKASFVELQLRKNGKITSLGHGPPVLVLRFA